MTYRELTSKLSDEEFAQMICEDSLINIACIENRKGSNNDCPFELKDCFKCVVKLLKSDVNALEIEKRNLE